ncbi:MAG: nucleoprotein/polynucleotide-associated enzyme [Methylophaga sp.]|nr:MAG: nucleoprotein/polynucleotide-associated enzyme [Methylophaga sp.]
MAGSLQDQLLGIGVIDKKKAKKSQHQKHQAKNKAIKAAKSGKKAEPQQDQRKIAQANREKQQRDIELNRQRDAERAKTALLAEVRDIAQQHSVSIADDADVAYNFSHENKVKKLYVTAELQKQLTLGQLAIVVLGEKKTLVPDKIAEKIENRLPEKVVRVQSDEVSDQNDPYADYQIPDDLMW